MRIEMRPIINLASNLMMAGSLLASPVRNADVSLRVLKSLAGREYGCNYGESVSPNYDFDIIAVLGAGSYYDEEGVLRLTSSEKGRLKTAAYLYVDGYAPTILLLNGRPDPAISISKQYIKEAIWDVSDDKISLDTEEVPFDVLSVNTSENMQVLKTYMADHGLKKALIVTDRFHQARSTILACSYDINSKVMSIEEVFNGKKDGDLPRPAGIIARAKELAEIATLPWDPKETQITNVKNMLYPEENDQ